MSKDYEKDSYNCLFRFYERIEVEEDYFRNKVLFSTIFVNGSVFIFLFKILHEKGVYVHVIILISLC